MSETLDTMRNRLQDDLDELSSPRSSSEAKTRALESLEQQVGRCCLQRHSDSLDNFLALQYTFECNLPLRLLAWINISTSKLETLTNKGSMDDHSNGEREAQKLSSQLALSLSLIQGVALNHPASKSYLSRRYTQEVVFPPDLEIQVPNRTRFSQVLLELLLGSRHLSSLRSDTKNSPRPHVPLTSVVLDTLLCILVDSPIALRSFEDSSGLAAIVKILKRAGTPREVRMKCLDDTGTYQPPPTYTTDPQPPEEKFISQSASGSSTNSFSSLSSTSSTIPSTPPLSLSPEKSSLSFDSTFPTSPPRPHQLQSRSLLMLKKDVDYTPQSPKKAQVAGLGVGGPRFPQGKSISKSGSMLGSDSEQLHENSIFKAPKTSAAPTDEVLVKTRTIEEKKEMLGTLLGNVDALVEGVRKAGVWGLG
ncbi:cell division control protein 14, SIN component-domain-containing protein [Infundibulicybe gibba]|nr:cell division control protein 14, SIN component-domain-containing protein [Infundibulicybe gibba]